MPQNRKISRHLRTKLKYTITVKETLKCAHSSVLHVTSGKLHSNILCRPITNLAL